MRVTMLVACHKPVSVPDDCFYMPIHVGHALNPVDIGFQPDDSGRNISALNRRYCELTAVYWALMNHDADAVGLSHYRRYFEGDQLGPAGARILSGSQAGELMRDYDLILGRPRNYVIETIDSHYRHGHIGKDLDILRGVVAEQSSTMLPAYEQVFSGRRLSLYNMFLMRRAEFRQYAEWLFSVLATAADRIGDEGDRTSYQQRTLGFMGERLLNVWACARSSQIRIAHRGIVNTEGEPKFGKAVRFAQRKFGLSDARARKS